MIVNCQLSGFMPAKTSFCTLELARIKAQQFFTHKIYPVFQVIERIMLLTWLAKYVSYWALTFLNSRILNIRSVWICHFAVNTLDEKLNFRQNFLLLQDVHFVLCLLNLFLEFLSVCHCFSRCSLMNKMRLLNSKAFC